MNDNEYRNYILTTQFSIPRKLNYLADKYHMITWKRAQELYEESVEELLKEFEVECILDIVSFGKGFIMAASLIESKLQIEYIKNKKNIVR